MGLISRVLGRGLGQTARDVGTAVEGVAEVFRPNAEASAARADAQLLNARSQFTAEFTPARTGFDKAVDGLNRLPRPLLAFGTLGLFAFAMLDPVGFGQRMAGLTHVPEPLWWLLGAVVSFYFGARELHHQRQRSAPPPKPQAPLEADRNPILDAVRPLL
ncbi:MAG: holin family protein [Pseudomonadota bacterium]